MRVIYIDELFAVNLILDYFLLLATGKLCAVSARRARLWSAAVVGAAYAVLAALPPLAWLAHPGVRLLSGGLVLLCAFGFRRRFGRLALVFFAVSATAAGAVMAAAYLGGDTLARVDLRLLSVAFGASYGIITLIFRRVARSSGTMHDVEIVVTDGAGTERRLTLRAMEDTGNSLSDPLSGSRVCVVSIGEILPIFDAAMRAVLEVAVLSADYEALVRLNSRPSGIKLRLLPYTAVGVPNGALLCFRPDVIRVGGRACSDLVIAISPNEVSDNGTYNALL